MSALFRNLFTRTEAYSINADSYGGVVTQADFVQSIGQEAIRMVGHVAAQDNLDRSCKEWTMTNETPVPFGRYVSRHPTRMDPLEATMAVLVQGY